MTAVIHRMVEDHWTCTDPRRRWYACACGATWTARPDKPARCPNDREEGKP